MASRAGDSNTILHSLLSSMLWKDEILQIGLFRAGDNVKKHLFLVNLKIEELNIPNEKQTEFFKKTLHQDVFYELSSLNEFNEKKRVLS